MDRLRKAVSALLVAGMVALPYTPALAKDDQGRGRNRDRYEDRWDNGRYSRYDRYDRDDRGYWDAARYYRNDERRYSAAPAQSKRPHLPRLRQPLLL